MGGKGGSKAPPPIDPGKSMGEYLFGKGFSKSYQGVTDPRLQDRLIEAEAKYRPQYAALELADINTMAYGTQGGKDSSRYKTLEAELAGLKAGQEVRSGSQASRRAQLESQAEKMFPSTKTNKSRFGGKGVDPAVAQREAFVNASIGTGEIDAAARMGEIESELSRLGNSQGQSGLLDMLEDQSARAGNLQREQLNLQRESDVGALREFAPQVVDAYRDADPYSTGLAEQQTAMANDLYQRSQGLNPEQQRMSDQAALGMAQNQGRVTDQSAVASQVLGRENYLSGLRSQAAGMGQQAFGMNRQLAGDVGMTILGRPSSAISLGGQMLGQATAGAAGPMGPQLFDPNVGINMALQQRGQDVTFQGMQAQAKAAGSAGIMGAVGSIGGAMIGGPAGAAAGSSLCWVAREVYGIENPKWLEFREWMLNDAPSWLRNLYLKYGERTAKFISNKPRVKSIIRKWMNTKIK
tara:strand:- start:213 stop:1610 length:1398 start_codon:yes stop_codon:yes gene_type:complete